MPAAIMVIDTNVLLDFWVFDDPRAQRLRNAVEAGHFDCVRSADTDDELADVLRRTVFVSHLANRATDPATLLSRWKQAARLVSRVYAAPWACTDPRDQKFLDLASSVRASVLVTKDNALLKVGRRAQRDGLAIIGVAAATERLARAD